MPGPLADVALWHRMIQGRQPLLVDAAVALSAVTRPLVVTALSLVVAALLVWRWRPVLALAMVCTLWWWARGGLVARACCGVVGVGCGGVLDPSLPGRPLVQ